MSSIQDTFVSVNKKIIYFLIFTIKNYAAIQWKIVKVNNWVKKSIFEADKTQKHLRERLRRCFFCGGDGGIRTHAPVTRAAAFRVRSLEPLGYISQSPRFGTLLKGALMLLFAE